MALIGRRTSGDERAIRCDSVESSEFDEARGNRVKREKKGYLLTSYDGQKLSRTQARTSPK